MVSKPIFTGAATALITPTTPAGVDYEALGRLIDWEIEQGIDALVIAGSTGEGKTLSIAEHKEVLRYSAERIAGRVPMIAGTGSNETSVSISMSQYACSVGADGLLVVTPYYIKATQNGLVAMYTMIADAVTKPLILYNVPSRTGVNIEPETYARLAEHPNIAGIKEANSDISKIVTTAQLVAGKLDLYSGNDDQTIPILSLGGKGVISVLSNLLPAETSRMCRLYFDGDAAQALLHEAIARLPEVQRMVFNLRYFDEMKYSEMSKLLDTSEGALKASYHLAVKKITDYVRNHDE